MSNATVGQILGQVRRNSNATQHLWGIVRSVTAPRATVQLQPGGQTDCEYPAGMTLAAGDRVLVLVAPVGNVVLAKMTPLALTETGDTP
jgi:hypothetical protein